MPGSWKIDRKSTRLNSSHTVIYTLSYTTLFRSIVQGPDHPNVGIVQAPDRPNIILILTDDLDARLLEDRSEEHTSELQSHSDLHSFLHDALPIYRPRS